MPPTKRFKPYVPTEFKSPVKKQVSFEEVKPYQEVCSDVDSEEDMEESDGEDMGEDLDDDIDDLLDEIRKELRELKEELKSFTTWSKQNTSTGPQLPPSSLMGSQQAVPVSSVGQQEATHSLQSLAKASMMDSSSGERSFFRNGGCGVPLDPPTVHPSISTTRRTQRSQSNGGTLFQQMLSRTKLESLSLNGEGGKDETSVIPSSN